MNRVFFDSNCGSVSHGFLLPFEQSKKDLSKLGNNLKEGALVVIYDPGEFEMDAVLTYDDDFTCWKAVPTNREIRYY